MHWKRRGEIVAGRWQSCPILSTCSVEIGYDLENKTTKKTSQPPPPKKTPTQTQKPNNTPNPEERHVEDPQATVIAIKKAELLQTTCTKGNHQGICDTTAPVNLSRL